MKKWEEQNRLKNYSKRISSAKPTLKTATRPFSSQQLRKPSGASTCNLLPLLKQFNLQQYYRKLKERGFEQNIKKLSELTKKQFSELMEGLSVLPGHVTNFQKLTRLLEEINTPKFFTQPPISEESTFSPQTQLEFHSTSTQNDGVELQLLHQQLEDAKNLISSLENQLTMAATSPIQLNRKIPVEISRDSFFVTPAAFEECREPHLSGVGKSLDSHKIRSTLTQLDIEELCRCFSRAVEQHIEASENVLGTTHNFRHKRSRVFVEEEGDPGDCYNFVRNLVIRGQLENQVPILALVYIDRLVEKTGIRLYKNNWKRLIFIAFVEASKVWDDESFENSSFAQAFTRFDISEINQMEECFLQLVDFEMRVTSSDFAKSYFILRSYASDKDSSLPLQALDVHTIAKLQGKSKEYEDISGLSAKLNQSM